MKNTWFALSVFLCACLLLAVITEIHLLYKTKTQKEEITILKEGIKALQTRHINDSLTIKSHERFEWDILTKLDSLNKNINN